MHYIGFTFFKRLSQKQINDIGRGMTTHNWQEHYTLLHITHFLCNNNIYQTFNDTRLYVQNGDKLTFTKQV